MIANLKKLTLQREISCILKYCSLTEFALGTSSNINQTENQNPNDHYKYAKRYIL